MSWRGRFETIGLSVRDHVVTGVLTLVDPELVTIARLRSSISDVLPPNALRLRDSDYVPRLQLGAHGIDYREPEQLARIERWRTLQPLFAEIRAETSLRQGPERRDRLYNGQFHTPDAEIYAAFIADRRPTSIIEVGAGFSTRIARRAIDVLGTGTSLTVIDPQPRVAIDSIGDEVIVARVEELGNDFQVEPGSFLFIDSSHVVRAGGDVPFLLNQIVPALPAGVTVQIHDYFCPWDYPDAYRRRLYTEQYVVQALLAHAPRFRVLFAAHLMARRHAERMRDTFGPRVADDPDHFGSSLWFETTE